LKNTDGRHFISGGLQKFDQGFTNPYSTSIDVNNDGFPDLIGGGTGDSIRVYYVKDSIIYMEKNFYLGAEPVLPAYLDVNNDGAIDIVVSTSYGIELLINDGYGNFTRSTPISTQAGGTIQCGDFDGDGWADIIESGVGELTVYHNNHDGTFTKMPTGAGYNVGYGVVYGLTVGDFDGSGTLDAVYTWGNNDTLVALSALNDGTGIFHIVQTWKTLGGERNNLSAATLTSSGALDFIMGYREASSILIFHNDTSVTPLLVKDGTQTPNGYALQQLYPSPVSSTASINYTLPSSQIVNISLYNSLGQFIETIVNGLVDGGTNSATYDCSTLPSGVFFIRLIAPHVMLTKEFVHYV